MMERLKDGSQVETVTMRERRTDRRPACGSPGEPLERDDVRDQVLAGEEDQSLSAGDDGA